MDEIQSLRDEVRAVKAMAATTQIDAMKAKVSVFVLEQIMALLASQLVADGIVTRADVEDAANATREGVADLPSEGLLQEIIFREIEETRDRFLSLLR